MSGLGASVASEFVRPARLRSPTCSCDGSSHTKGSCSSESSRIPTPPYRRELSVPASQNAAPLDRVVKPPMSVRGRDASPDVASFRDAQKFALPAPPPTRPAFGRYVDPICSAILTCAADMFGLPCRRSAVAPLTIGVAMLVPLNCMYALTGMPARCRYA